MVCDVSGRNPNVFFELGIRMATQKPTVIVKDDKTTYPFDTAPNRYIEYPRDLRHPAMEKFKKQLIAALEKTINQPSENSFIGQLGPFQIPDVQVAATTSENLMLEKLDRIEHAVQEQRSSRLSRQDRLGHNPFRALTRFGHDTSLDDDKEVVEIRVDTGETQLQNALEELAHFPEFEHLEVSYERENDREWSVNLRGFDLNEKRLRKIFGRVLENAIPF